MTAFIQFAVWTFRNFLLMDDETERCIRLGKQELTDYVARNLPDIAESFAGEVPKDVASVVPAVVEALLHQDSSEFAYYVFYAFCNSGNLEKETLRYVQCSESELTDYIERNLPDVAESFAGEVPSSDVLRQVVPVVVKAILLGELSVVRM